VTGERKRKNLIQLIFMNANVEIKTNQYKYLSPMLFLLVIEVLNGLFRKTDAWSLLQQLPSRHLPYRVSMYVDDVVLFFSPSLQDLQLTTTIFDLFKSSSGLCCNVGKCQIVLLRCDEAQIQLAHEQFPCPIKEFPIQYLGMPMSTGKLPKSTLQPLTDRMVDRLPAWKGWLMHRSVRLTLIKMTLAAIPIYTEIGHDLPPWLKSFTKMFN
jgi:hypothetical protein